MLPLNPYMSASLRYESIMLACGVALLPDSSGVRGSIPSSVFVGLLEIADWIGYTNLPLNVNVCF